MGVLIKRAAAALLLSGLAVSCASQQPSTGAFAAAARGACGDAELVKKELIAMRQRHVTRMEAARVLGAAARRIDERAETAGGGAWRLHDLAASFRVMRNTIAGRGDEGVASSDTRITRAQVGCSF
jgi:hypothetical protein